jgi:WD40 repeat protein
MENMEERMCGMSNLKYFARVPVLILVLALFCVTNLEIGRTQDVSPTINSIDWSPDGVKLALGYSDGTVRIIDTLTSAETLTFNNFEVVTALAWSPTDANSVAISGIHIQKSQSEVIILDAVTGRTKSIFVTGDSISSLDWSPDGSKLGVAKNTVTVSFTSRNELQIWDANSGRILISSPSPSIEDNITALAWSPDNKRMAGAITNHTVIIWDASTGAVELTLQGHSDVVLSVEWSPDGTQLATTGSILDNTMRLWASDTGQNTANFPADFATVKWSPEGHELALAEYLKVRILDPQTGIEILNIATNGLGTTLVYSPYGGRLAFGGEAQAALGTSIQSFSNGAVQIIVPAPSPQKLEAITQACGVQPGVQQSLTAQITTNKLQDFTAQVSALTDAQIPPGCKADLLAVAEALMAQGQ